MSHPVTRQCLARVPRHAVVSHSACVDPTLATTAARAERKLPGISCVGVQSAGRETRVKHVSLKGVIRACVRV